MTKDRLFVGVMSGTSVDGIDAALVRVVGDGRRGGYRVEVLEHVERKWPEGLRGRLLKVMAPAVVGVSDICELNVLVGREFAGSVERCLKKAGVAKGKVAGVGSHGQTICHLPGGKVRATLQIGSVSVIATLLGMVTVGDFRLADMAVGGQGAPLVPWTDLVLLGDKKVTRCVQNVGGIGNVTFLLAGGKGEDVVAFDTGPGNMVMDAVVGMATGGKLRFDKGGRLARKGRVDEKLLGELKGHGYFKRKPPKSTGREEFGVGFAEGLVRRGLGLEDLVCTLARLTSWSIGDAYRRFLPRMPEEVILCGGGADNPVLVGMIGEELGGVKVRRMEEFGIPNKAKEAASFALLGAATLDGVCANLPSVTGARCGVVLGVVARP